MTDPSSGNQLGAIAAATELAGVVLLAAVDLAAAAADRRRGTTTQNGSGL